MRRWKRSFARSEPLPNVACDTVGEHTLLPGDGATIFPTRFEECSSQTAVVARQSLGRTATALGSRGRGFPSQVLLNRLGEYS